MPPNVKQNILESIQFLKICIPSRKANLFLQPSLLKSKYFCLNLLHNVWQFKYRRKQERKQQLAEERVQNVAKLQLEAKEQSLRVAILADSVQTFESKSKLFPSYFEPQFTFLLKTCCERFTNPKKPCGKSSSGRSSWNAKIFQTRIFHQKSATFSFNGERVWVNIWRSRSTGGWRATIAVFWSKIQHSLTRGGWQWRSSACRLVAFMTTKFARWSKCMTV